MHAGLHAHPGDIPVDTYRGLAPADHVWQQHLDFRGAEASAHSS